MIRKKYVTRPHWYGFYSNISLYRLRATMDIGYQYRVLVLTVVVVHQGLALITGQDSLSCRVCKRATNLAECTEITYCNATTEACFIAELITENLRVVYTSGCQSKELCGNNSFSSTAVLPNDLVACFRCCADHDVPGCNERLCGISKPSIGTTQPTHIDQQNKLLCRRCDQAKTLADCESMVTCDSGHEYCFMDEMITEDLAIIYNGGCRSKEVCGRISPIGRKRQSLLVACSKCCGDRGCNSKLCGIQSGIRNGTVCATCSTRDSSTPQGNVVNPSECFFHKTCQQNEACYIQQNYANGYTTYELGCRDMNTCRTMVTAAMLQERICEQSHSCSAHTGQQTSCTSCCGWDGCNYETCGKQNDFLYRVYKQGLLDMSSLTIQNQTSTGALVGK